MALVREQPKPKEREKHAVTPIHGEFGRYSVPSSSAAKKGEDEAYVVDVLAEEMTETHGKVVGTCGCKGWSVRKNCTHLIDAKEYHEKIASVNQAAKLGFEHLPPEEK